MTNNYGEMQNIYLGTDNARLGSTTAERPKWSDEHILALKRAAADIQDIRENRYYVANAPTAFRMMPRRLGND